MAQQPEVELTRSTRCCYCLVSDEVVQVFGAALHVQVTAAGATGEEGRLVRNSRPTGARATGTATCTFRSDRGGEDEGRRVIASETYSRREACQRGVGQDEGKQLR